MMTALLAEKRDIEFVLYEQLDVLSLCDYDSYSHLSRDEFDMILEQAFKFAENEMLPANADGDRVGAKWDAGSVTLPKSFYRPLKLFGENGWVSVCESPDLGGLNLPITVFTACNEVFHAANTALNLYPSLAHGTFSMIHHYGTEEQKKKYLAKLLSYEWAGSMNLTEPGAGSALAQVQTRAEKIDDTRYRITGQKIFITAGDHDAHPNIIHPVLARIKGDPAGIRGISIFLVPKYHVNADGSLGERNDVTCAGIEHKMGIRGSATCQMSFGDRGECIGELLGKPCQGIAIMFLIMNEERLNVGVQSVGLASAAYLNALKYARERRQGTDVRKKGPPEEIVTIINHPDVRRNLLHMKAHVEGLRALNYFTALCLDRRNGAGDREQGREYHGLAELLTPLCKAYSSIRGFEVCSNAMNVYGGYGYCMDYPAEQFLRDQKITALYEGTNAIHSIDLLARKLGMDGGRILNALLEKIDGTIEEMSGRESLLRHAGEVKKARDLMVEAFDHLKKLMDSGEVPAAFQDSLPFLEITGDVILGWMHLWQLGIAENRLRLLLELNKESSGEAKTKFINENNEAAFYAGKISSAQYFISKILPMTGAKVRCLIDNDRSPLEIEDISFGNTGS